MIKNRRSLHKFANWFFGLFWEENSRRLGVQNHFKAVAPAKMSGTNPPLNENFEFLKIMIFNLIFLSKIWKYFSEFF